MSGRRPWVLIGALPPPTTGQAVAFRMLVDGCVAKGVRCRVVDISERGAARRIGGFTWRRAVSLVGPLLRASWLCVFARPGVVYLIVAQSWSGFLRDRAFVALAALARRRIVLHVHGGGYGRFYAAQPERRRRAIRRMLERADRLIVLGDGLVDMFDFLPDHRARVAVVPNGLALDEATLPGEPRRLPAAGEGPVRVLYLSNLIESKGYLDVLEAVRTLAVDRGRDVECDFCGEFLVEGGGERFASAADAERGFAEFVRERGLEGRVRWRGVVLGDELGAALAAAHFLALPTRYPPEGQPLCIIEAMAHGCVVLASRYRAIPEMLDDGRAGIFVEFGDPATIVDAIEGCLADPARFEELSRRALEHRRANYTADAYLERMFAALSGPE